MFLNTTVKRNPKLIDTAFSLHQSGKILPDSYVIDMDQLIENAKQIKWKADRLNIKLYFMLKQLGRNPYIAKKLVELGYEGAVVVDFKEAQVMMKHQIPIGNLGHLVQTPNSMLKEIISYGVQVITVYSLEKVELINQIAEELHLVQKILLRVYDKDDYIYSGQTAGFSLEELPELVQKIKGYSNIEIAGVTSFPCYLFQEETEEIKKTKNLDTVLEGKKMLEELGYQALIINTPSSTCVKTLSMMSEDGSNCGEPGHGLTGTTPEHTVRDLEEIPSVVYVSEISHNFLGKAYCYGGGHYRRSHMKWSLVGKGAFDTKIVRVKPPEDDSIDYHFELEKECEVGDTVVMAFRFQVFVTRSDVVLIEGISKDSPNIVGIYDSLGNLKDSFRF